MEKMLKFDDSVNLFLTSYTHYGHKNIVRGESQWGDLSKTRNFDTVVAMNETLVKNINELVGEGDVLIHLGDFSFGGFNNIRNFRERIACKNIHLVLGNHDEHIRRNKEGVRELFSSVSENLTFTYVRESIKYHFFAMHLPVASWPDMNRNVMHVHGHVHLPKNMRITGGKAMDVGVDGNDLKPIHIHEVIELLRERRVSNLIIKEDHHI